MSTAGANKCGDTFALFRGVATHADFLAAEVLEVSDAARALGAVEGMTGRAYLELLRGRAGAVGGGRGGGQQR